MKRDASPAGLRRRVEASLAAPGAERIALYQLHRVDPAVPIEESVGALETPRDEGEIGLIGLCNVDEAQLRAAVGVAPIASVQNRYDALELAARSLAERRRDSRHDVGGPPRGEPRRVGRGRVGRGRRLVARPPTKAGLGRPRRPTRQRVDEVRGITSSLDGASLTQATMSFET